MTINFQRTYSPVIMFLPNPQLTFENYVDDLLDMDGSIYLDLHGCSEHLEHITSLRVIIWELAWAPRHGTLCSSFLEYFNVATDTWTWALRLWISLWDYFNIEASTYTWDPSLWMIFLDYFIIVASHSTWDPGSFEYFSVVVNICTWDLGLWLYILTISVERNTFGRGMECWDPP